jgi:hypothetical protein
MKRTWVKLFCTNWLDGTMRQEAAEVRGVWADIIALAGEMGGDTGILGFAASIGFSDEQLAAKLNLPIDQWKRCKLRLAEIGCIDILGRNVISVRNWKKYQSEYQRQKAYRSDKPTLQPQVTTERNDTEVEVEVEVRSKKRDIEEKKNQIHPRKKSSAKSHDYPPDFQSFWETYPHSVNKVKTFSYWTTLLKEGITGDTLIACARHYADEQNGEETKYIMHSTTFLGTGRRWEDYIAPKQKKGNGIKEERHEADSRNHRPYGWNVDVSDYEK